LTGIFYLRTSNIAALKKYKRILLKLSGEALMADKPFGIDPTRLNEYAD
jgi:uridylate kinase